ncbi:hypothetical protein N9C58_00505, partial [bacterium]|nr:hypothetical protein [bacterium]
MATAEPRLGRSVLGRLGSRRGIGLIALGALLLVWIIGGFINSAVYFSPVLFGLSTGAIIAGLALGLVVAYRASGVINFSQGA